MTKPTTVAEWDAMSPEEQDALIASGWHPGPGAYSDRALQVRYARRDRDYWKERARNLEEQLTKLATWYGHDLDAALGNEARVSGHEAASPLYREEQNRWLSECSCGWEQDAATHQEAWIAWENHKAAMDELEEERIARERGTTLRLSSENPRNEREQLELRLRRWLDDDDAVTAVQEMLDAGWRPPSDRRLETHEEVRSRILACIGDAEGRKAVERARMLSLTAGQIQALAEALTLLEASNPAKEPSDA